MRYVAHVDDHTMTTPKKNQPPKLAFPLSNASIEPDGFIRFDPGDIQKLDEIGPLVKALGALLPKSIEMLTGLAGERFEMRFMPSTSAKQSALWPEVDQFTTDLCARMTTNLTELRANKARLRPLPDAAAVSFPDCLPLMHAVEHADTNARLKGVAFVGSQEIVLPKSVKEDYVRLRKEKPLAMTGTFEIVGIRRDDENGHILLIGNGDVQVRLPHGKPKRWHRIHKLLDDRCFLEGKLERSADSDHWRIASGTRLVRQKRLI